MNRFEVIVVGGGVVGAATALAFRRAGLDVALVERGPEPAAFDPKGYDPRVYAISPGSVRFLERLGVWPRVVRERASAYGRMEVWERDPARALTFDAAESGVPELGFIVEESLLRSALWSALAGAERITGATPSGLRVDAGRGRLELEDGRTLTAPLIVSAEGTESKLREWAGIDPLGWSYSQRALACHVATEQPHGHTAYQRFLPTGPLAFLPLADGRSSIVWSAENDAAQELMGLDDRAFRRRLGEAIEHRLGDIGAVTPRLSFPLRLQQAREYVRAGLALVGDSAHVIHPLAGQGVNLGLADAEALAEIVLDAREQRRDPASLRVLKRYERRRKAEVVEMSALTDGLQRLFATKVPLVGTLRRAGMGWVDRAGPLKRRLAERAMGL